MYNKAILIGFLGSDAEVRTTKNGTSYRVLSLATKRSWRNDQGTYDSRTYWRRAIAWGRLAAFAATLKKGAHLQLVGEVRTREYEKEYGSNQKFTVKHRVCEISLESMLKLDRAERQDEQAPDIEPTDDPAERAFRGLGHEPGAPSPQNGRKPNSDRGI